MARPFPALLAILLPAVASASGDAKPVDFTGHWGGWVSLLVFIIAYAMVIGEETLHLRKSKPVIVAAGII